MSVIVVNTASTKDCTIGILQCEGFRCFTLELPWLNNVTNISCVPSGKYEYKKRLSPTLGKVIHILDVSGRTWIYIHKGNFTSQIEGCILVGTMLKDLNADNIADVGNSAKAFDDLMHVTSDTGTVIITDRARSV